MRILHIEDWTFDLPDFCEIGRKAMMMHGNDNKTRERELGQPGLECMRLVAFCDSKVEKLFRPVISHETNYVDGQETGPNIRHSVSADRL